MGASDPDYARLDERMTAFAQEIRNDLAGILDRLDGGPSTDYARSVRGRLHRLEAESAAAKAAGAALAQAQHERRKAEEAQRRTQRQRGGFYWRFVGAAIAAAAVILPYVHPAGAWHH